MTTLFAALMEWFQTLFRVLPETYAFFFNTFNIIYTTFKNSMYNFLRITKQFIVVLHQIVSVFLFSFFRLSLMILILSLPIFLYFDPFNIFYFARNVLGGPEWFGMAHAAVLLLVLLISAIFGYNVVCAIKNSYNKEENFSWNSYTDSLSDALSWLFIAILFVYFVLLRIFYIVPGIEDANHLLELLRKEILPVSRQVIVRNRCDDPAELAISVQTWNGQWKTHCCWRFKPNERFRLHVEEDVPLNVYSGEIYIYGRFRSGALSWRSVDRDNKKTVEIDHESVDMYKTTTARLVNETYFMFFDCDP